MAEAGSSLGPLNVYVFSIGLFSKSRLFNLTKAHFYRHMFFGSHVCEALFQRSPDNVQNSFN